jgi:hypothetical protein
MPLSVAAAIVVGIYVVRSATRGFDFRPDLPIDAIVGVAFLLVVGAVAYLRREGARADETPEDSCDE